jgi:AcrR family transcriptional regulator
MTARGRPRKAAIDETALRVTRELLHERGYEALGMREIAERAGIGLGALYRRWPGKRDLVVSALRVATDALDVPPTDDAEADVLRGLVLLARSLTGGVRALLAQLLAEPESELAQAIREAKLQPFAAAHRRRLERLLGPVPDLDDRVAIAPALIVQHLMTTGRLPTEDEIRERIMPLQRP